MSEPAPLWAIRLGSWLDDGEESREGGRLEVFAREPGRTYLVRVTLPHPDYYGPDVVAERVVTRERLRRLWRVVQ